MHIKLKWANSLFRKRTEHFQIFVFKKISRLWGFLTFAMSQNTNTLENSSWLPITIFMYKGLIIKHHCLNTNMQSMHVISTIRNLEFSYSKWNCTISIQNAIRPLTFLKSNNAICLTETTEKTICHILYISVMLIIIMIITCSTVLIEMALSHYCAHIVGFLSTSWTSIWEENMKEIPRI